VYARDQNTTEPHPPHNQEWQGYGSMIDDAVFLVVVGLTAAVLTVAASVLGRMRRPQYAAQQVIPDDAPEVTANRPR
jgi:hypothetical protein